MENFGAYLKAQREAKNIRLEEIASITKINLHSLRLLEKGEWSELPPEPFIRGFIIAYSKYIGLDVKEAVRRFLESRNQPTTESSNSERTTEEIPARAQASQSDAESVITASGRSPQKRFIYGAVAAVLVGVVIAVSSIGRRSVRELPAETLMETTDAIPSGPLADAEATPDGEALATAKEVDSAADVKSGTEKTAVDSATEPNVIRGSDTAIRDTAAVKPEIAPAETPAKQHEVVVEGKSRTWMKTVIDDQKPRETFLKEGEIVTLTAYDKIKVVLGNSTGTKVVHNGELVSGEKFNGTIRSYIFPKTARFPQDPPKRVASGQSEGPKTPEGSSPSEPATAAPIESN